MTTSAPVLPASWATRVTPPHVESYLTLQSSRVQGQDRQRRPLRKWGPRPDPASAPRLGAHLNVRPRPESWAHIYRPLGGRRAAFWRGVRRRAQLAGRLRSEGAVSFPRHPSPSGAGPTPPPAGPTPPKYPLRREPGAAPSAPQQTPIMGSQSSKAPRGDVTAEEAAGASPAKANGQVGALGGASSGPLLPRLAPSWGPGPGPRALSGPGHAAPPPPPGPFVLRAAAPAGEARGGAERGRQPGPAAFFVRGPGPRRCPPAAPSAARGTKALLGRAKGAPRGLRAGAGRREHSPRRPNLVGPRSFLKRGA